MMIWTADFKYSSALAYDYIEGVLGPQEAVGSSCHLKQVYQLRGRNVPIHTGQSVTVGRCTAHAPYSLPIAVPRRCVSA